MLGCRVSVGIEIDRKRSQIERLYEADNRRAIASVFRYGGHVQTVAPYTSVSLFENGQFRFAGGPLRRPEVQNDRLAAKCCQVDSAPLKPEEPDRRQL